MGASEDVLALLNKRAHAVERVLAVYAAGDPLACIGPDGAPVQTALFVAGGEVYTALIFAEPVAKNANDVVQEYRQRVVVQKGLPMEVV